MKTKILFTITLLSYFLTNAQEITLEYSQKRARENYPLISSYGLIEKSKEFNLSNANKNYLPQISFSAKATYQSDVTSISIPPINIPGMPSGGLNIEMPEQKKDQYQVTAQVDQLIWDGGATNSIKKATKAQYEIDKSNIEVSLYSIKERVCDLYFGILLLKQQITLAKSLDTELNRNLKKVETYVDNGIANDADISAVKVQILNNKQNLSTLEVNMSSYYKMLSHFIGEDISKNSVFETPNYLVNFLNSENLKYNFDNRPEITLFNAQHALLESNKNMLTSKNMPKLGAFLQGGYGRPGLNMMSNDFDLFAIAGVRLSWNFGSLYTLSTEKKQIANAQNNIQIQKDAFIFNTNMQVDKQLSDIERIQKLLVDDDEIIRLRENIKNSAEHKMENGTITVTDYLNEVTNEDIAKQNKTLRGIQLLMSIYKYKNIINN